MTALPRFSISGWFYSIFKSLAGLLRGFVALWAPISRAPDASIQSIEQSTGVFPPTEEQVDDSIRRFVDKVDKEAISNLVSIHLGGEPSIFDDTASYGSFNACFLVRYNSTSECIVRIPIAPVVVSAWEKLESEVATMRYIESKTTIPVPQIFAYGSDESIVPGAKTPFIIMSVMPGKQLHTQTFVGASTAQRKNLFAGLIDALAQLRQLEFNASGSLRFDDNRLGPIHSMAENEYRRNTRSAPVLKIVDNAGDFLEDSLGLVGKCIEVPCLDLEPRIAKLERFALHSTTEQARAIVGDPTSSNFILMHQDLRPGNIFIDDNFRITGIIDWEFSYTMPQALFTPPSWVVGDDPDMSIAILSCYRSGLTKEAVFSEFRDVLAEGMDRGRSFWETLWREWKLDVDPDGELLRVVSAIAHIVRSPCSLVNVYSSSIFRVLYGKDARKDEVVDEFLTRPENAHLKGKIAEVLQSSRRFSKYLEHTEPAM